ncbi:MAG: phosphoribosyltransferase family protein [Halobacteriota archaeon]|nr:phosphoribosyltransferase family protein [Halobacteriota archaeon]
MLSREEVSKILLEVGALSFNLRNPLKYPSGILTPIQIDCSFLESFPEERSRIISTILKIIEDINEEIDVIVGCGPSAIPLTTHIASHLKLKMAYVRASKKEYGKEKQIEGTVPKGSSVLLVSDELSTRDDIPISIEAVKGCNARIAYCLTIFNYNLGIQEELLEQEGIPLHSLTDLETLLNIAFEEEKISDGDLKDVKKWVKGPEKWSKNWKENRPPIILKSSGRDVAEILLRIKAVTLSPDEPYRYASGMLSPIYTDNRLLMSNPKEWEYVINSFAEVVEGVIGRGEIDLIAGTATSGISHAAYLAEILGLPMIYVKSSLEEHGKRNRIEGKITSGDRVLVIEDLISTGTSAISAARALRESGGIVGWCMAIFSYQMEVSKSAFEEEMINLITLTDLSTLIGSAVDMDYIKSSEREIILNWAKNPKDWKK